MKTVSIAPTTFAFDASSRIRSEANRALAFNAVNCAVCVALSDTYQVVSNSQPSDLIVRTIVADIVPTDKTTASVATAVILRSGVVLPVSAPLCRIALGELAVEAEAVDSTGVQHAAMLWTGGATSIQNEPRVSETGNPYGLAFKFGNEFSRMLVTGKEPKVLDIALPSTQRTRSWFGGKRKYAACDALGRALGLAGAAAAELGAQPQWTDGRPNTATSH